MKWITWITTYTLIVLAELGDKTQVATLILSSNNPRKRWVIFAAAALALSTCVVIEVTVGSTVAHFISQEKINLLTGIVFLAIGLITLIRQYAESKKWKLIFGIIPKLKVEKETTSTD